ncbi:MAG TPA: hypothetical protein VNT79_05040, partial [Phycisphaerae bacterium]|nr:hypothetical protein [Phycisphaerae bacterium]
MDATSKQHGNFAASLEESGQFNPSLPSTQALALWQPIGQAVADIPDEWPTFVGAVHSSIWTRGIRDLGNYCRISQTAEVIGFTDQCGGEWTRKMLIDAVVADPMFDGSLEIATAAFRATFEDPNLVASEEA